VEKQSFIEGSPDSEWYCAAQSLIGGPLRGPQVMGIAGWRLTANVLTAVIAELT
jgi:hypothetical protein